MTDKDVVDPMGTSYALANPSGVDDFKPETDDVSRILPRQISTGYYRGTQTISGELLITDPSTNNAVMTISGPDQNMIFSDPVSQTNQVVIGNLGNGVFGMKVAPTGTNVLTATDADLIFNSSQNIFKIVGSGTLTIPAATVAGPGAGNYVAFSGTSSSIPHGLDFTPAVTAYIFDANANSYVPIPFATAAAGGGSSAVWRNVSIYVDSTFVYAQVSGMITGAFGPLGSAFPITVKYYLTQESAN